MPNSSTTSMYRCLTSMYVFFRLYQCKRIDDNLRETKSSKSVLPHSWNSATPSPESSSAQTSQREDSIFPESTGSFSTTHQTILEIISTGLGVLLVQAMPAKVSCSSSQVNWASSVTSRRQRFRSTSTLSLPTRSATSSHRCVATQSHLHTLR